MVPWLAMGGERVLRNARARKEARPIDRAEAAAIAAKASEHAGLCVGGDFVMATLKPPGGRLNALVYEQLSTLFGIPAASLKRALFPGLRGPSRDA